MFDVEKELNELKFHEHELGDATRQAVLRMAYDKVQKKQTVKRTPLLRIAFSAVAVALAALMIFIVMPESEPTGYYTIDINPSISVAVDHSDTVLKVFAENDDARRLLEGTSLQGLPFEQALRQVVVLASAQGYFEQGAHLLVAHFGDTPGISAQQVETVVSQSTESPVRVMVLQSTKNEYQEARRQNKRAGVELLKQQARDMHVEDGDVGAMIDSLSGIPADTQKGSQNANENASKNANAQAEKREDAKNDKHDNPDKNEKANRDREDANGNDKANEDRTGANNNNNARENGKNQRSNQNENPRKPNK